MSCGSQVLVDQNAQDRFSADPRGVEVCGGAVGSVRVAVRDALGGALMRPGGVVVLLVLGQDGTQMCRAEDQLAVQELTAQRAGEPLADRVHPRSLDGGAQDRGASGLEYGVERGRSEEHTS